MKYTVVWQPLAQAHLAARWLSTPDRARFTKAANEIEALLASNPKHAGEPIFAETRVLVVAPLAVLYDVIDDDRQVKVLSVTTLASKQS